MDTNALISRLDSAVPGAVLESRPFGRSSIFSVWIEMQSILRVAEFLKHDPEAAFDCLECLSVMDIDQALVLTYFLRSTPNSSLLILRGSVVPATKDAPVSVQSVTEFWPMAGNFEEEIQDLFGVDFGHVRPAGRALLPDGWVGYPLRKSYVFPTAVMDIPHARPANTDRGASAGTNSNSDSEDAHV